ncbi:MAG: dicarboxylate/amino acid:cation symporter [Gammaproteobacteria bacterium]|nr:dicarboxylate/amino acid:cation symporter [Gammaproteobacteria bacterium]MBQ0774042.1 dicarboxylate/amino acid:cation symporter [Gammaproteobacteria bacterium]
MRLHNQIFIAMAIAIVCGTFTDPDSAFLGIPVLMIYDTIGSLFINALKMVVVPLIVSAIISSLINIAGGERLGKLGMKTMIYYMSTSFVAIVIGLLMVNLLTPGLIDGLPAGPSLGLSADTGITLAKIEGQGASDFAGIFLALLPPNIVNAAAQGELLGLIVFSIMFGLMLRKGTGAPSERLRETIDGFYQTMMDVTMFIIRFAPIGVWALIAKTVTLTGADAIRPLAWFFLTTMGALLLHAFVVLPLLIRFLGKRSPLRHIKAMAPALLTAFSSASSAATLPLTMDCVEKGSGVSKGTASFVLPLGATVNMDGTALYECVAAMFIAQAYGLDLSLAQQFLIVITALLTSVGVASIPSASLVAITVILGAVGLPAEGIGLILATDRILDMCRTAVNIWSDSVGAVLIGRSEGEEMILMEQPNTDHTA